MNSKIKLLALTVLISGCSATSGLMNDIMSSWEGSSLNEVIASWGYPHAEQNIAGKKLYIWNRNAQLIMPSTAVTTGTVSTIGNQSFYNGTTNLIGGGVSNWNCTRIVEVNANDIVVGWSWQGNNCPFMEAGPYSKWRRR